LLLVLLLICVSVFALIFHEVIGEGEVGFDMRVFGMIAPRISAAGTRFMEAVTFTASATFLQIAYGLTIGLYLLRRNWLRCIEILVIGIGGFALNYFMKLTFHRLRPPNPILEPLHNFSFPSGHATSGFIFYGLLAYLAWKLKLPRGLRLALAVVLIAWALLVGFSRIYLRMHFATDVLAGFCIGASWLGLSILILQRMKKKATIETGETEEQAERAQ
ncbi:MAG: phosphatase PAP2 family protein, partial [Chitinophagaceae bacterium]